MFGLFQSGMAFAGMAGGSGLARLLNSPLRFAPPLILCAIGLVMILGKPGRVGEPARVTGAVAVIGAAVSVSLDALGAGVAMGLAGIVSLLSAAVIGFISVGMSVVGFAAGGVLGRRAAAAEKVGGLILIGLAVIMFVTGF
jgi:putative Mn2+ efflux pump MntP